MSKQIYIHKISISRRPQTGHNPTYYANLRNIPELMTNPTLLLAKNLRNAPETNYFTVIIGCPKKVDNMAIVAIVKLCSPLNHLVTSFGRFPKASANCFLFKPFCCIRASSLFEIAKERRVSSRFSRGISSKISFKEILAFLITHYNITQRYK